MNTELLPCPFCGGGAEITEHEDASCQNYRNCPDVWSVLCQGCEARVMNFRDESDAIDSWNTRIQPATNQDGVRE